MEKYTAAALLDILAAYKRMIDHDDGKYPAVILDDINKSIAHVLGEAETQ